MYSGYEVILAPHISPAKGDFDCYVRFREARGLIAPDELKIFVNKTLSVSERVITLIHELLHEAFPAWEEAKVETTAQDTFSRLTRSQLGFFQFFVMTSQEVQATLKANGLSPA